MATLNVSIRLPTASSRSVPWPVGSSDDTRQVTIDLTDWLVFHFAASLSSVSVSTPPTGITLSSVTTNGSQITFSQTGGANGQVYTAQFKLTTNTGLVEFLTFDIPVIPGVPGALVYAFMQHLPPDTSSGGGGGSGGVTQDELDAETQARMDADNANSAADAQHVSDEIGDRNAAIASAIAQEVSDRNNAITTANAILASGLTQNISSAINTEVVNRNTAISNAIATEVTSRNSAISAAVAPVSAAITQEVSDRNTAIASGVAAEATARDTAIGSAINSEVTNRNTAISNAIATEVTSRNAAIANEATARDTAIGTAINSEVTNRNTAISNAIATEVTNRNTAIASEATARDSAIGTAINNEVTNRNTAINNAISQEVSDRNAAISAATSGSTGPRIDKTGVSNTPTDGGTYTVPAGTSLVRFRNTGPLKLLNITLPTSGVVDGQEIEILSVNTLGTIASIVFTPGVSGYPTANNLPLPGAGKLRLVYDSTAGSWVLASTVLNVHQWHGNFKNLLHNSTMLINQRGFTSSTANGNYAVFDRWFHTDSATGTRTITAATLTDTDRLIAGDESIASAIRVQTTGDSAASSFEYIYQNLEDVRRTAGRIVTFSFYAKAAAANQPVAVEFYQNFGSGGSPSAAVSTPAGLFQLTTTLKRYFGTVTLPTCQGKTFGTTPNTDYLGLFVYQSAGSAYNTRASAIGPQTSDITITGLQLEFGNAPTLLERRDREIELNFCRRFYQVVRNYFVLYSGGTNYGLPISNPLNPPMRASPTVVSRSFASTSNFGGETTASAISQPERYIAQLIGSAAGATYADATWVLSADL